MAILIFDFDGTIHDSMCIYAPAVRTCYRRLVEQGILPRRHGSEHNIDSLEQDISDDEIRSYLGLTAQEMWQQFAPELSRELQQEGSQFIYREMARLTEAGEACLYDGALEMLEALKTQGHRLVFLSNCSVNYRDLHTRHFGLDRYFDEIYCSEQFAWKEKWQIAAQLALRWQQEILQRQTAESDPGQTLGIVEPGQRESEQGRTIIAIGDRYKDMEIRKAAEVLETPGQAARFAFRTIFCAYGFGEPAEGADADAVVNSPEEILRWMD